MDKKRAYVITCFDYFDNRSKAISNLLNKRGYCVKIYGANFDHIKKEKTASDDPNIVLLNVPSYRKNLSVRRIYSHILFSVKTYMLLRKKTVDLLYVMIPPNSLALVTGMLKKKKEYKLIYDVIDLWPESMPIKRFRILFNIWRSFRNRGFKYADYIFLECMLYKEKLFDDQLKKSSVLHLFKKRSEREELFVKDLIDNYNRKCGIVRIAYLGSINYIIDIDAICNVIDELSKYYSVEVVVIGDGENKQCFLNRIDSTNSKVEYYGAIFDESKKAQILSGCDAAFNLMVPGVSVGLTTKSIDYLSVGVPLINNIKGDTWLMVESKCIGINYSNNLDDFIAGFEKLLEIKHEYVYEVFKEYFTIDIFENKVNNVIDTLGE